MPELPEVETVKEGLKKKLLGRTIINCQVRWPNIIQYPDPEEFIQTITNKTIKDITRRGKFILFHLDDYCLISHLRMEGKYFIKPNKSLLSKHDHVIFQLDNDEELRYNDTRKFGTMHLVKIDELTNTPVNKLGLEPWDQNLTLDYLKAKFNKKKAIKTLLLDQEIIAGIGNIYANEILFLTKIHPEEYGCNLSDQNILDIIKHTKTILERAIQLGGTTVHTYQAVDGITGRFQQELLVHSREGQACPVCHKEILKIVVNTRGTYYCPHCQKKRK